MIKKTWVQVVDPVDSVVLASSLRNIMKEGSILHLNHSRTYFEAWRHLTQSIRYDGTAVLVLESTMR